MPAALKEYEHCGALPVHSRRAMVATADVHATNAAISVMRNGGNAIDAAVTAAFALSVTQPGMCGLGGGGHLMARFADGRTLCLDFREQAPRSSSRDMFVGQPPGASSAGWLAAATPGTVRGLENAHRRLGRVSWHRVLEPAVELAAEGHAVSFLRANMLSHSGALHQDVESRRILLRDGVYFEPGEILRQPELATTLARIARNGGDEFYRGETARQFARACADHGGLITAADLENYTSTEPQPLKLAYRDYDVWAMPPSSAGGTGLLQTLAILQGTDFAADGPLSATFLHFVAEAMRRVFADRAMAEISPRLLDEDHIAKLRQSIDPRHATPSASFAANNPISEGVCTTHVSVLDSEGNAVALTFTINGRYGSGVTVPKLGFLLNNNMDNFAVRPGTPNHYGVIHGEANAIAPGKRPLSSMTPTIVCRNGRAEIVMGTPGGPTIVSAMAQALLCVLEFGWNPRDAVDAPRIHHQWLPDILYAEYRFPADVIRALESRGHRVEHKVSLTDMNAVVSRDGWLQGAADCRREGCAVGI